MKKLGYLYVIAGCLCVYIFIRSFTVDFTHDEAYSFKIMKQFWHVEALCTANTHWINSAAMKAAMLLHLEENWQLRWLSLLSGIVFIIITLVWAKKFNTVTQQVLLVAITLFNPFVLDYFVLARGYASALMFQALALFLFFYSVEKQNRRAAFISLCCAALSVIANYSFLYFFIGFVLIHFIYYYVPAITKSFKNPRLYIDSAISLATLLFVIRAWIYIVRCSNDTGAGSDSFTEACNSFFEGMLYQRFNLNHTLLLALSCVWVVFIASSAIYGVLAYNRHNNNIYFYTSIILITALFFITINFLFFNALLPYGRSALFLFPLVCITSVYFYNYLRIPSIVYWGTSIFFLFGFFKSVNLTHTLDFAAQQNTHYELNYLDSIGAKNVAMNGENYGVFTNYYQLKDGKHYNFNANYMKEIKSAEGFDYVLLFPPPEKLSSVFNNSKLTLIKQFTGNGVKLYKVEGMANYK